jgi:transcriptional regulator with XRE-family HTH domain
MIKDSKVFSGFKIKGLRLKNHKNLQEVAKALDITTSYLSSIENGKKEPSSKVIAKASVYFDTPEASFHEPSEYLNDIEKIVKNMDLDEIIQAFEVIIHSKNRKD